MRSSILLVAGALTLALVAGCTEGRGRPSREGGVPSGDGGPRILDGCDASMDADSDGIADAAEGTDDQDGDGTPNYLDGDSDGDGISDLAEHDGAPPCSLPDADGDGIPNWRDLDSDNDGLTDAEEFGTYHTDPRSRDTDGDGITDLGEVRGTMTDPTDPGSSLPEGDFFVVLPYNGDHQIRTLRFGTTISQADVYFLIDTTGSMGGPIANVQSSLRTIAGELGGVIRDVQMGVGHFEDFPNSRECAPFDFDCLLMSGGSYGSGTDVAYAHIQDITPDVMAVQRALDGLTLGNGADAPESHVEALYQTATGEGGSWSFGGGIPAHTIARRACPSIPDDPAPRRGYPCFRSGSLPIIVLVSDVVFHNGNGGTNAYMGITPAPHTFAQAAMALNGIGARMIGVAVGGGGRPDQDAMARMTGTVDGSGTPIVYDAPSGEVSRSIIDGIGSLVGGTPQDVTTATEDVPGNPGGVDARGFIRSIRPVEGYGSDGLPGARPGISYTSLDATTFYGVVPGTQVEFSVDFWNDFVMPPATAQIYRAVIVVVGNGVARLDERQVYIIVPPEGATILI